MWPRLFDARAAVETRTIAVAATVRRKAFAALLDPQTLSPIVSKRNLWLRSTSKRLVHKSVVRKSSPVYRLRLHSSSGCGSINLPPKRRAKTVPRWQKHLWHRRLMRG